MPTSRRLLRWLPTFLAFPLAGLLTIEKGKASYEIHRVVDSSAKMAAGKTKKK